MKLLDRQIQVRDRRAVRQALAAIKQNNKDKLLVAKDIVEAAEDEDSPLHNFFTWDDSEAASQWRLMQARSLIRQIEVTYPDDKTEKAVPKYVSLISDRKRTGGGYRETNDVLSSKALIAELETTAKRDIDGLLRRYEILKDLCSKVRRAAGIKTEASHMAPKSKK